MAVWLTYPQKEEGAGTDSVKEDAVVVDDAEDEGGVGSAVRAGGERARPGGGLRSCEPGCPTAWCQ